MIRLHITRDGRFRGLWTDAVDFTGLGGTDVRRASPVEFDRRKQQWYVREAIPCGWLRRWVQRLFRRPMGRVIHFAPTRGAALEWERRYFEPGGRGMGEGQGCRRRWSSVVGDDLFRPAGLRLTHIGLARPVPGVVTARRGRLVFPPLPNIIFPV